MTCLILFAMHLRVSGQSTRVTAKLFCSTCHWCHVMERESFESEEVANIINDRFVSIKVDREERPDVDRVYVKPFPYASPLFPPLNTIHTPYIVTPPWPHLSFSNILSPSHQPIPQSFSANCIYLADYGERIAKRNLWPQDSLQNQAACCLQFA